MNLRPIITNKITVPDTISQPDSQECNFLIEKISKVFSYKCCEVEDEKLRKGGDYAFTFTFGNMGECPAREESVTDCITVQNIGGIQLKLMDYCEPCYPYTIFVSACVYNLRDERYEYKSLLNIGNIQGRYELVVCPSCPICFYVYNYVTRSFQFTIPAHSINNFAAIFQVEDIFCESDCRCTTCPRQPVEPKAEDVDLTKEQIADEIKAKAQKEIDEILASE